MTLVIIRRRIAKLGDILHFLSLFLSLFSVSLCLVSLSFYGVPSLVYCAVLHLLLWSFESCLLRCLYFSFYGVLSLVYCAVLHFSFYGVLKSCLLHYLQCVASVLFCFTKCQFFILSMRWVGPCWAAPSWQPLYVVPRRG